MVFSEMIINSIYVCNGESVPDAFPLKAWERVPAFVCKKLEYRVISKIFLEFFLKGPFDIKMRPLRAKNRVFKKNFLIN